MEQILNGILHQLYPQADTSGNTPLYYVEFWKRGPWHHILAHADMDEGWERQERAKHHGNDKNYHLKHPETGHVLYLEMGSQVQGPTVVWNVTNGGEFFSTKDQQEQQPISEMISVPAKQGRLLRFQGDLLHAVPRPADIYWTLQPDSEQEEPVEQYQRSVLLFNTWRIDQGMIVDYQILNGTNSSADDPQTSIPHSCNPKTEWKEVEVVDYFVESASSSWYSFLLSPSTTSLFQVPLMGNAKRRGMEGRVASLETNNEHASDAMKEVSQVTRMMVQPARDKPWFSFMGMEF
jgi:hypothetical protein